MTPHRAAGCTLWPKTSHRYCSIKDFVDGEFFGEETCSWTEDSLENRSYIHGELNYHAKYALQHDSSGRLSRYIVEERDGGEKATKRTEECVLGYDGETNRLLFESCAPSFEDDTLCTSYSYDRLGRLVAIRMGDKPCKGLDVEESRAGIEAAQESPDTLRAMWDGGNDQYIYDEQGRLVEKQSCDGALGACTPVWRYEYDQEGHVVRSHYKDLKSWDFGYDMNGRLGQMEYRFKSELTEKQYEYDTEGRVIRETWIKYYANGDVFRQGYSDYLYECDPPSEEEQK